MDAEKILAKLTIIATQLPQINGSDEYKDIVQSLKQDIALRAEKNAGRASQYKAALRFAKYCVKYCADRPLFRGAHVENGKQYITDTHKAVRFDTPFEGLPEASNDGKRPNFDKVIDTYNYRLPATLPTLAELKTELKINKAQKNLNDSGHSLTVINGRNYNTDYLIQMVEMINPKEAYFTNESDTAYLVMIGDGAQGVVTAIRGLNKK